MTGMAAERRYLSQAVIAPHNGSPASEGRSVNGPASSSDVATRARSTSDFFEGGGTARGLLPTDRRVGRQALGQLIQRTSRDYPPPSPAVIDSLAASYASLTGVQVTAKMRGLLAIAWRVHGPDTPSLLRRLYAFSRSTTNLLANLINADAVVVLTDPSIAESGGTPASNLAVTPVTQASAPAPQSIASHLRSDDSAAGGAAMASAAHSADWADEAEKSARLDSEDAVANLDAWMDRCLRHNVPWVRGERPGLWRCPAPDDTETGACECRPVKAWTARHPSPQHHMGFH